MTHFHEAHPHYEVVQAEHARMIREQIKANNEEQRRITLEIYRNVAAESQNWNVVRFTEHQLDTAERWLGLAPLTKTRSKSTNGRLVYRKAKRN